MTPMTTIRQWHVLTPDRDGDYRPHADGPYESRDEAHAAAKLLKTKPPPVICYTQAVVHDMTRIQ